MAKSCGALDAKMASPCPALLALRSLPIEEKSNEIPAIKPLLECMSIEGSLLTADAMHRQQETARLITQDHGADYIFGLKGNQSGILKRATTKLDGVFFPSKNEGSWDKGHGKLVRRRIKTLATTPEDIGFTGCWRLIAVERSTFDLTPPKKIPATSRNRNRLLCEQSHQGRIQR
jgi:hypothetical protein